MEKNLPELRKEANELRIRLAHLEAAIRRQEHELWHQHNRRRYHQLQELDEEPPKRLDEALFGFRLF